MASAATSLHAPAFLRWRQERWPRTTWARWVVRLAVAVPFVGLADLANRAAGASAANVALHRDATSLHWASGRLGWVAHGFPPVPLAIARVFPGGASGLAIAGGLCTGVLIQLTIERMILRSVPIPTTIVLAAAVAATPVFWYLATGDFATFLTLSLLSVALTGLLDFTFNRSTGSGFIAGISFGFASLCDLSAVPFALAGALAAFFVTPNSHVVREVARRRAAAAVVLFPTVAAIAGWEFLQWRFSGSWTASLTRADPALFRFPGGVWQSLWHAVDSVGADLVYVPVLIAAGALLLARRPMSLVPCVTFVGCVIVDLWVGAALSGATVVILLAVVGLAMLPERPTVAERSILWVCVAVQVATAFVGLHHGLSPVADWLHQLVTNGLPRL
jgi:hypothetical protein